MRTLFVVARRRVHVVLGLLCAGILVADHAAAQSAPPLWASAGCASSSCHNSPPNLATNIDFADNILFQDLNSFKAQIGKSTSNLTMRTFAGTAPGTASTYTDLQRQSILDYLVQVRSASVTAAVAAFPLTDVNQTSATTRQVTIVNYRGEPLNFTPSLSNATDFSMSNNCAAGPSVAAQSSCSITIGFSPAPGVAETRLGNLTIVFAAATAFTPSTRTITLSGSVNPPVFNFVANAGPFSARVNQVPGTDLNVGTLRNIGSATLALSSLTRFSGSTALALSPADPVARAGACTPTQQLGVNTNCPLWVRFTPTAQGDATATFRLVHQAAGSPSDVVVTATGTQPLINPTSAALNFGDVQLGAPTLRTVTLNNIGNMVMSFTADPKLPAARTGTNSGDYSVATSCSSGVNATLAAGTPCTVTVTFTPPLLAPEGTPRTATLTVSTDANNNGGLLTVDLTGNPVALPPPTVASPANDFPDTVIGDAAAETRQIVVANPRTTSLVYALSDTTDFKIVGEDCPTRVVPGGGSCTVTMEFRPVLGIGEGRRSMNIPVSFTGSGNPSLLNAVLAGRALLPLQVSVDPVRPNAVVGSPGISSVLLTNRRSTALTFTAATLSGPESGDYSLDPSNGCTAGLLLNSGSNCTLVLKFNPPQEGPRNATLTLVHTAAGSPQPIAVNGTAAPKPQGRLSFCSDCLNFADTQLGSGSVRSIAIQNTGTLALTFSAFSIVGTNPGDFTQAGTCVTSVALAIGAQCTIEITFRPAALGARSGRVRIDSDATDPTVLINLTGAGVPVPVPMLTLTPGLLAFGEQTVGGIYPSRTLHLSNTGTADLAVTAITVTGQGFSGVSTVCLATLKPGTGCAIELRFAPLAAATDYTGAVSIQSNAGSSLANLSGRGIASAAPSLTWEPTTAELAFGNVATGSISAVQRLTLRNNGPGGARLSVINAVGTGAGDFSVAGGSCRVDTILLDGAACTVDVSFAPGGSGARSAALQAAASGSVAPAVTLTGTGLGGPTGVLNLSATALNFEATRVGAQSLPAEITLSNEGSGSLRVTDLSVTGPYTIQNKTCPSVPFLLSAGTECTATVMFTPPTQGDAAGTLSVTTDADHAAREVALSGHADAKADLSSGGCSVASGHSAADPTLWALALLAIAALAYRRRARATRLRAERNPSQR